MSIGEADSDNGVQGECSSATLLIIQNSEVQVQRDKAGVACLRYRRTLVMCGSHRPRHASGRTILLQQKASQGRPQGIDSKIHQPKI